LNLQEFEYIQKIEILIRLSLGQIRVRPSCTVTRGPRPQCRRGTFAQCTWPRALSGRPRPARPTTVRRCAQAHTGAVTALRAHVTAWPAVGLSWQRWNKGRCSSIHGIEATRQASGWRRQLTRASRRWEGWKNRDGDGVFRRGGGSDRIPVSAIGEVVRGRWLGNTVR
jgi:hypothetical protein